MNFSKRIYTAIAAAGMIALTASGAQLVLDGTKKGAPIAPTMYGLFFEDINYAADGGLYAELIKNRSFEFHPDRFAGWNVAGNIEVMNDGPFERNPHYLRLTDPGHHEKRSSISNEGFFGIDCRKDADYRFSVWARPVGKAAKITVQLIDPRSNGESQILAQKEITVDATEWKRYETLLRPSENMTRGELRIFLDSRDAGVDLEHVSLFPVDTFNGRKNGMRKDIAEALYNLHPGVLRFPGGCIVEGADPATRYQWKNTVGPVENRPLNENRWQSTFRHRFFPDYFQSLGLGFYEYFQLAEDLGATPLPVLNVGMVCQYQNSLDQQIPLDSLHIFIQDARDLIEFANGDTTTVWGALRADMGHPAPFGLEYLAIGNEQWGPEYVERLTPFVKALRESNPEIKIIGSSGPNSEGKDFDYLWPQMRNIGVDLVDEHFYRNEDWFAGQGLRYDSYPRKGTKVFAGEYACHGKNRKYNHYNAALHEAAFMTGLERNADVVLMATYAPLLAHVDGWQWRPDLIWFDNTRVAPSASYYVQQLFASNKGTRTVSLSLDGRPATGLEGQENLWASAVYDEPSNSYIVKAVNTGDKDLPLEILLKLPKKAAADGIAEVTTLACADLLADNTLDNPARITPAHSALTLDGKTLADTLPAKTIRMYRIPLK